MSETKGNEQVIKELANTLAGTYALMLKYHKYHWNVTGPRFHTLHEFFEVQYTELFAAADEIAERMRAIGAKAPGSFAEFEELLNFSADNPATSADDMLKDVHEAQAALIKVLQAGIDAADDADDDATEDLFIQRKHSHDKTQWMIESFLG